jgi:hypothetical protein
MTDYDAEAKIPTDIQAACRKAKQTRSPADLEAARLLMLKPEVEALRPSLRDNLRWAYGAAVMAVTGAFAP